MASRRFIGLMLGVLLLWLLLPVASLAQAQDDEAVQMTVETAYDNAYRPENWLPLRVQVRNEGLDFSGRIVVRPATSGLALSNSYSTPLDLPVGSEKVAFLYVRARRAAQLTIELIDNEGVRVAQRVVGLNPIDPYDALHVLLTDPDAPTINLNGVAPGGYDSAQARWELQNLPPDVGALLAITTLTVYQADTANLTVGQREALAQYVSLGGHLLVVGGLDWQATAAGFDDLLPFQPEGSESIDDFSALATYIRVPTDDELHGSARIATGTITETGRVLVETEEGVPLIVRREYGSGTIDYLTFDPTLEPVASWENLPDLWFTLFSSTAPEPGWGRGFLELQEAARAIAILPGVDLLPPVLSMVAFVVAYILLIGPVNYLVLSRFNRPGWAWFTIPLFIVIFTGLAFTVGFNLRGNDVIVSQLRVVQSDPQTGIARQDQLIGILSPRREVYEIGLPQGQFFTVLEGFQQSGVLQQGIPQSGAEIVQGANFRAENVVIDGGLFANFASFGTVEPPAISGSATITYEGEDGALRLRGIVRNDSEITLQNVAILAQNRAYPVPENFAPGDVLDFSTNDLERITTNLMNQIPIASPFESAPFLDLGRGAATRSPLFVSLGSARAVMNETLDHACDIRGLDERDDSQLIARRSAFLCSFMRDQFGVPAIGQDVYLIGWAAEATPADLQITDVAYQSVDTGLYIIRLDTTVEQPSSNQLVTVDGNQFTWTFVDRNLISAEGGLNDFTLVSPATAVIRIMPLAGAVLADVQSMTITLDRSSSYGRDVGLSLWDWDAQEWVFQEERASENYTLENPARFLGTNNM
ncbi:MAG: hypothetical protein KC496_03230, partial [Anaerolineae bacterium]|nr:hypothetical protein [Anaerolineae bacterium]